MGKASRDKGARFEREIVHALRDAGLSDAARVPLSGSAGGEFAGDINVTVRGQKRRLEAKKRANGFATIERWLGDHYALVIGRDRGEPMIVLRLKDFADLADTPLFANGSAA